MYLKIFLIFAFFSALDCAVVPKENSTINVQDIFQKNCQNELKAYIENTEKELNSTQGTENKFNITSVECLMFCGYKKAGVLDTDGNVVMNYFKSLVSSEDFAELEPVIAKCASTEKTTNVCEKALKNIKCVFQEGLEMIKNRNLNHTSKPK